MARLFYPYGSIRRVLRGPSRGTRFYVAPAMGWTYAMASASMSLGFLANHIRSGDVVWDVGSNRGQLALFFAHRTGPLGAVVAVEPIPELAAEVTRNADLNGYKHIRVVNAALCDADGTAEFLFDDGRDTQGKLSAVEPTNHHAAARAVTVQTKRADQLLAEGCPPPNLVKIDVEGAAAALLRGATELLDRHRPRIFIELHGPEEQGAVRDHLQPRGYRLENIDGVPVSDPTEGWHSPLWCVPV